MKKTAVVLSMLFSALTVFAASAKIDFDGRADKIKLKVAPGLVNAYGTNPSWAEKEKDYYLCFNTTAVSNTWKRYTIAFIPDKSGVVRMGLRGSFKQRPAADWIAYDDFKITGSTLQNPSFEDIKDGFPVSWVRGNYGVVLGAKNAVHGKNYTCQSHNIHTYQEIKVTAGVPVVINFAAKFDRQTPDQIHPLSPILRGKKVVNNFSLKRDLTKPARIKIDIDARQFRTKIISAKAGKGLIIRPDKSQGPEKVSYYEVVGTEDLTNDWQEFEFSFALDRATNTKILLRSLEVKGDERWVAYDDLKIEGVKHSNPSFEFRAGPHRLASWDSVGYNVAAKRQDAAHGNSYAMASFDHAIRQYIYPWEVVTIKFKAKNAGAAKAGAPYGVIFDKPRSYYRLYNAKAKYLPLSDKGLAGKDIIETHTNIKRPAKVYPEFAKPDGKATAAAKGLIPFELFEESGVARTVNVRVGIPLPEKSFYNLKNFAVNDPSGKEVPAQYSAIAWWPDKSIKSVLVEFRTELKANEKSVWHLAAGKNVKQSDYKSALTYTDKNGKVTVSTGVLTAIIDKKNFALLSDVTINGKKVGSFAPEGLKVVDENGKVFTASAAAPTRFAVEEKGPVRLVFRIDGKITDGKDFAIANYVARIGFNANSSKVDFTISYYNTNLKQEFTDINSYGFTFVPAAEAKSLKMNAATGKRIFQQNDLRLEIDGKITEGKNAKISGGGEVATADGKITFGVKDFWQRYPKAVNITDGKINFELLPVTNDKKFNTDLEWFLQFPYCEGKYRMKWGMGFTEEVAIDFAGNESAQQMDALSIIPVIDRDWLHKTKVFEGTLPKKVHAFDAWDEKMVAGYFNHMMIKERQREYGFLNYGDNYGERNRNWNNNEYDFANGLFLLFLRTGRREIGRWAFHCARHQADVDIVHAYPDSYYLGCNAQHAIGHTGVSYQNVNPATWSYKYDYAYIGTNGHTWSDGMLHAWMYTGDAVIMDSALMLGNHLVYFTAPGFTRLGTHERSAGWSVRAILAFYRATGDEKFFKAARHVVNKALAEQNFEKGGAWPHPMPGDHSGGHKNTFGNCPYLMGILSEMMRQYYRVDPRPEVKRSLIAVAGWLRRTHFKDAVGWPYGASWDAKPYHRPGNNTNGLILPGLLAGGRLEKNPENYEIVQNAIGLATLQGYSGAKNTLAMGLVFNAGTIDEMGKFAAENPEIPAFDGDMAKFVKVFKKAPELRSRGGDKKEFKVILKTNDPVININRVRWGARPQGKAEYNIQVVDPSGKVIFDQTPPTRDNKTFAVPVKGKAGDVFTVKLDDDMAAVWNIAVSDAYNAFAVVLPGYTFGNGGITTRFFTVPAGTEKFEISFQSVHPGGATVFVCDDKDNIVAKGFVFNSGSARFPWASDDGIPQSTTKLAIKTAAEKSPRVFKILMASGGDIALGLKGIPPMISLIPVVYPAK